jgi:hypothetical protein
MVYSGNSKWSDDKQCLNIVTVSVLKLKSIHAELFMKINVCSSQEMVNMHLFYGCANANSKEARS